MVNSLKIAIERAESLSERDQEALAAIIEAEISDEARWQSRFAETPATLNKIAERAKRQYDAGQCGDQLD